MIIHLNHKIWLTNLRKFSLLQSLGSIFDPNHYLPHFMRIFGNFSFRWIMLIFTGLLSFFSFSLSSFLENQLIGFKFSNVIPDFFTNSIMDFKFWLSTGFRILKHPRIFTFESKVSPSSSLTIMAVLMNQDFSLF